MQIVCSDIKTYQWEHKVEILIPSQGRRVSSLPRGSAEMLKVIGCDETRNPNDMR